MKNILIIEANNYHEEVILPQLKFLIDTDYKVSLFINEKVKNKGINFSDYNADINYIPAKRVHFNLLSILKTLLDIKKNSIDIIIFNSLEDKYVKVLSKFLPATIQVVAIVHNLESFEKNRLNVKNFLVLNQTVLSSMTKNRKNYNCNYFYPLVFQDEISTNKNKILEICIPGKIEHGRRDYLGLLKILNANKDMLNIKFIILGNISQHDGPSVMAKINEYQLNNSFQVFNEFVPYEKYFKILSRCDFVMPLIHPNIKHFDQYHTVKISAAFSMGFSFKIPFLMYESIGKLEEFSRYSAFYNEQNLLEVLKTLEEKKDALQTNLLNDEKISFEYQQKNYLDFLATLL